jgi:hypothetical protein
MDEKRPKQFGQEKDVTPDNWRWKELLSGPIAGWEELVLNTMI